MSHWARLKQRPGKVMEAFPPARIPANEVAWVLFEALGRDAHCTGGEAGEGMQL
jgi:hypothetical protein